MGQLLIPDVDEDVIERLQVRAKAQNRSLEAELRDILYLASRRVDAETARKAGEELSRRLAGRFHSDSGELIREDRDR